MLIGAFQVSFVANEFWGFAPNTVFRSYTLRLLTGAMCGLIVSSATLGIEMAIRRFGIMPLLEKMYKYFMVLIKGVIVVLFIIRGC